MWIICDAIRTRRSACIDDHKQFRRSFQLALEGNLQRRGTPTSRVESNRQFKRDNHAGRNGIERHETSSSGSEIPCFCIFFPHFSLSLLSSLFAFPFPLFPTLSNLPTSSETNFRSDEKPRGHASFCLDLSDATRGRAGLCRLRNLI